MKTNDCRSAKLFAMTCVAALLTLPLLAQEQKSTNDSTKREKPYSEQPRFQGGRFVPAFGRFMEVLTDEQRTSLQQAMAGQHEKARELEEKTRDLRRAILEASATQEFDESTVRSKALALAKF